MDVLIRTARERGDYDACVNLQREVWGLTDLEITSAIQLVATVHAGGLLLVAESRGDGVVGFCYAFAALRGGEPHSPDMLAVGGARGAGRLRLSGRSGTRLGAAACAS
jgi:predicted GNAT superfamily acetyltransferase